MLFRTLLLSATVAALASVPTFAGAVVAASPAGANVTIDNYTFKPATITVPVGATVTWKNLDDDPHTATADDGSFNSKGLAQGDSFSFRFTKPGTYVYHCTVHPFMKATVVVKAPSGQTGSISNSAAVLRDPNAVIDEGN